MRIPPQDGLGTGAGVLELTRAEQRDRRVELRGVVVREEIRGADVLAPRSIQHSERRVGSRQLLPNRRRFLVLDGRVPIFDRRLCVVLGGEIVVAALFSTGGTRTGSDEEKTACETPACETPARPLLDLTEHRFYLGRARGRKSPESLVGTPAWEATCTPRRTAWTARGNYFRRGRLV